MQKYRITVAIIMLLMRLISFASDEDNHYTANGHAWRWEWVNQPNTVAIGSTRTAGSPPCALWNEELHKLESLTVPSNIVLSSSSKPKVTVIGTGAFYRSDFERDLVGISLPDSIEYIYRFAFCSCSRLSGAFHIPNRVKSIGDNAFCGCSGLTSMTIPNSVQSIGFEAFRRCSGLTSVTIGNSVTNIGYEAFLYCTNLTKVCISDILSWCRISFEHIDDVYLIARPFSLENYASSNPLCYAQKLYLNDSLVTDLIIPDGVTSISDWSFVNCSSLKSIRIPNSVTNVGRGAFYGCSGLTNVTIGAGVRRIHTQAFEGCNNLSDVYITDLASWCRISFDNQPLNYAHNLYLNGSLVTDLRIPDGTKNIGCDAFYSCDCLNSVTIPDSVTNIEVRAFAQCSNLAQVFLPTTYAGETTNRFTRYTGAGGSVPIIRYKAVQTVSFDAAGGTMSSVSKTVRFGSPYGALPVPVREGYGFAGWWLNGASVTADTVVRALDNHTLMADWAGNSYTLSFNANGGTGDMGDVSLAYGVEVSLPQNTFHRRNYVFAGWATNATDEAVSYGDGVTVSNMTAEANATLTLYAVWAPLVVATPESTPESGSTFGADTCTVSLSCATEGAAIYYSTNGVTPRTSAANLYSEPFEVSGDVTVIAVAKFEDVRSDYMTAIFTKGAPAVPVIEPCDGTMFVGDSCEVSISCDTEGVAIYYSTNGAMPQKTAAYRYTGPFSISATTTIKAFSANDTFDSECTSATIIKWDMTLAEAVGAPSLAFTTGGDAVWTAIADNTAASGYSAKSGEIGDAVPGGSNITWLATTVTGTGTLGFDWKVACEHDDMGGCTWDRLMVFTNDVEAARIDGVTGWEGKSFVFDDSGVHTVRWVFLKDDTNDEMFEDCAWVSGVTWTPSGVADIVVDVGGGKTVTVPGAWIAERTQRAATDDAANGRKVWECYVLGLDPEDNSATNDFKITSFPLKANGTPDLAHLVFDPPQAKWNVTGARAVIKGAAALDAADWLEVTEQNKASFRFFKVTVEMP